MTVPKYAPMLKAVVRQWLNKKGYVEVAEGAELHVLTGALQETSSQFQGFLRPPKRNDGHRGH